jgi:hypothetical protein
MTPLTIIGIACICLILFGIITYGISGTFLFNISPPFIQQASTYEFRNHLKQSFYEQEQ